MITRYAKCATALVLVLSSCGRVEEVRETETKIETGGPMSFEDVAARRRSVREFSDERLSEKELLKILFAAQGITDPGSGHRSVPSAGATYPLEVYLVSADGVLHYDPSSNSLKEVVQGDLRADLSEAALGQSVVRNAPASVVITGFAARTTQRYGERGHRYVYMEAGHAAQNVLLQAVSLGLAGVPIGAFDDREVEGILGCRPGEKALYILPVGHPVK